jgi:sulfite oxidase
MSPQLYRLSIDTLHALFVNLFVMAISVSQVFNNAILIWYLQCAGNRRTAMSNVRKVRGVGWGISALGNGKRWVCAILECSELKRCIFFQSCIHALNCSHLSAYWHPAKNCLIFCIIPATWGGAKLSDVLELVGIPKLSSVSSFGGKHVEFVSVDKCKVSILVIFIWQQLLGSPLISCCSSFRRKKAVLILHLFH